MELIAISAIHSTAAAGVAVRVPGVMGYWCQAHLLLPPVTRLPPMREAAVVVVQRPEVAAVAAIMAAAAAAAMKMRVPGAGAEAVLYY